MIKLTLYFYLLIMGMIIYKIEPVVFIDWYYIIYFFEFNWWWCFISPLWGCILVLIFQTFIHNYGRFYFSSRPSLLFNKLYSSYRDRFMSTNKWHKRWQGYNNSVFRQISDIHVWMMYFAPLVSIWGVI